MARVNAKKPIYANGETARDLDRLSKAALIDVVVDCCKRMFGEDVWEESTAACLYEVCHAPLRERGDKCPFPSSQDSLEMGAAFDEKPYAKLK